MSPPPRGGERGTRRLELGPRRAPGRVKQQRRCARARRDAFDLVRQRTLGAPGRAGQSRQRRGGRTDTALVEQAVQQEAPEGITVVEHHRAAATPAAAEAVRRALAGQREPRPERELGHHVELQPSVGRRVVAEMEAMRSVSPGGQAREAERRDRARQTCRVVAGHEQVDVAGRRLGALGAAQQTPPDAGAIQRREDLAEERTKLEAILRGSADRQAATVLRMARAGARRPVTCSSIHR
jgi:hypothetical protein